MDILVTKCIVLFVLLVLTFMFSMLPLKLVSTLRNTADQLKRARYGRIISLLSCFAGGVFMGTGLLDLFPEVNDMLSEANVGIYMKSSFPVAEFTVAFGFLVVLILEQLVKEYKEKYAEFNLLANEAVRPRRNLQPQISERQLHHGEEGSDHSAEYVPVYDEPEPHPKLRSIILLLALSVHSLFEGLAIGLQPDMNDVLQIFIAVVIHKVVIAFSLGLNLVQTDLSLSSIIKSNFLFSVTSPVGIGIALAVEQFGNSVNSSIMNGILQGLACGTFVYVTFFEVLPHELGESENRILKLLALIGGLSVVCFVLFLDPSSSPHLCPYP